jgi:fructose-bisphosphate aldolase, class I
MEEGREGAARRPARGGIDEMNAERHQDQLHRIRSGRGFIAALDQSGGSTPKALRAYGIEESAYADEAEMYDLIHAMRARIMTSPAFTGDRVLGAILFERTMDRQVGGKGTAEYLWEDKRVVPFLKVDTGLEDEADGVRLMRPMPDLDALLERAGSHGVFGTKMRSVVLRADGAGVEANVAQQLEVARRILEAGFVPIIEPEVDIHSPEKAEAEELVTAAIAARLDELGEDQAVMLKLTPPEQDDLYADLVAHPRVLRVVLLSGGYSREEANVRLSRNHGAVASFSRALTEGLSAQQSQDEFDAALDSAIESIFRASLT